MLDVLDGLRVTPGSPLSLRDRPTDAVPGSDLDTDSADDALDALIDQLDVLQQRLYAEDERAVLLVLGGLDTSGKDGAIKGVFRGITPAATQVVPFKAPTATELEHDFLWRVHAQCPPRGRIGVFNRSHYEDVIAARVRGGLAADRVRRRYGHINAFEKLLDDEGTTVVKCLLHLSKDEQAERLHARLDDPEKRWKFRRADLDDRARWDDFQAAFGETLEATSTDSSPWYVVPADRKWLRNIVVAAIVVHTLERLDPRLPPGEPGLDEVVIT